MAANRALTSEQYGAESSVVPYSEDSYLDDASIMCCLDKSQPHPL